MKVLILSITAGQGHHQTGKAIGNYFEKNGHTAIKLDCYEYLSPILKEAVSSGYLVSTKYSPALYGKMYDFAEEYEDIDFSNKVVMGTNHLIYRKLKKYILELAPDAIICTHVFAAIRKAQGHRYSYLWGYNGFSASSVLGKFEYRLLRNGK